jgi:hypothetical protein
METNMETNQPSSTVAVRKVTMEDMPDTERDVG